MSTPIALYQVKPSYGYACAIFDDMDDEEPAIFYTAGNHVLDSQIYNSSAATRVAPKTLRAWAKQTMNELIDEYVSEKGLAERPKIRLYNGLLLSEQMTLGEPTSWVTWPFWLPNR